MYQALYRKYRPRTFSDVAGQEHITETLRKQVMLGRLSHAYLFVGTRGTGKTTCAKVLSRAVNCRNPVEGNPCNECDACTGIESGAILDVLEIDAASNNGVDNVRALREEANYVPVSVAKRVYIIDEVHMLSTQAFNALLKTLEEPPEHIMFILATTELHKVPATILSRCQRFSFKRISSQAITERLNDIAAKEGVTLAPDAAQVLASIADGSMRDAISLLDQCASDSVIDLQRVQETIGLVVSQEILKLTEYLAERDAIAALGVFDDLYVDGRDMSSLLNELAAIMRDILIHRLSPESGLLSGAFSGAQLSSISEKFTPERIFYCLDTIREAMYDITRGGSARLSTEMCIIRLCYEKTAENTQVAEYSTLTSAAASVPEKPATSAAPTVQDVPVPIEAQDASAIQGQPPADALPEQQGYQINDRDQWSEILDLIKDDEAAHALISDNEKVYAEIREGFITIYATDAFSARIIEGEQISGKIKEAARIVLGRDIAVRVVQSDREEGTGAKEKTVWLQEFIEKNFT